MNIEAIRKAAEATLSKGVADWYDAEDFVGLGMHDEDRAFVAAATPSAVLELCRLAEIGECFVNEKASPIKMRRMAELAQAHKESQQ